MSNEKYIIKNKKNFRSIFNQISYSRSELMNVIKTKRISKIEIIAKYRNNPINEVTNHFKFCISIESKKDKILELVIKDMKVDMPLTEDAARKISNLEELCIDYMKYIKSELERYFKKYDVPTVEIMCSNGFCSLK